ncbi:MAG: hypothetical protein RLZZ426_829 [Actinomycetota bacterium]|jgi:hypothetical protein
MHVAISGASGLIGTALTHHLTSQGHQVTQLVRRPARNASEISWNPATGELDSQKLSGIHAVVNLSGAGVGDHRWTERYKKTILNSRLETTGTLARAMASNPDGPRVLINGSAIGIYGDRGNLTITEQSVRGAGFLADVVEQWEAAAAPASAAGIRVVFARTGLVLTPKGGAFAKLLPLFKLGLGGVIAGGKQYWSFISLTDEVRALQFLIETDISGAVNLTTPHPVTNAEVTKALSAALHRPALLPVPGFALDIVLGEFAKDITTGAKIIPEVLQNAGFVWNHPTIDDVIKAEVL